MLSSRKHLVAYCGALVLIGSVDERRRPVPQSVVAGIVFDSLSMRPLAGASVHLALPGNEPVSTVSTDDGSFRFAGIAAGRYLLNFTHARLDSLGLEAQPRVIQIADGDSARVRLTIPSARTIAGLLCPGDKLVPGRSTLLGFVRSAGDGAPIGESTVSVRFDDFIVSRSRVQRDSMGRTVVTKGNGYYVACGLPAEVTVLARAISGRDTSGYLELELPPNEFRKRDLYIGKTYRVAAPIDSTAERRYTVQVLRGEGLLAGTVTQSDGRPISGARVSIWGTGREVSTNDAGTFALDSLPTGSQMVEVRALGFVPHREAVDLPEGTRASLTLRLTGKQTFLDTVKVLTTRAYVSGHMAEFENRRKHRVGGFFLDADEIDRRRAAVFTDLLRGIPTVLIDPSARTGDQVRMIGASNENDPYCDPTIWIDGSRQNLREVSLNAILFPERITAIEVYSRTVETPSQYQYGSRCGVILIWTGERVRRQIAPEKR
ncbi:MAG TPA: carboxypeptidase-like regulatory domain-containing protein [Gemmatimonadaceae bacterium]|nr:carboxypeptidase-like regulatory domain-containing protein [Gemmatimonadaceae bacterium]